jgi:primary-amine oxidase
MLVVSSALGACSDSGNRTMPLYPEQSAPVSTSGAAVATSADAQPPEPDSGAAPSSPLPTTSTLAASSAPPVDEADAVLPPAGHPLDGLTPDELQAVRTVLDADDRARDAAIPYVTLLAPPKEDVLAWTPGDPFTRRAFVVLRKDGQTFEAVVSIADERIESWTPRPGAQPGFTNDEFARAISAATSDQRLLDGLEARGLAIGDASCLMFAAGTAVAPAEQGRRLGRVTCYATGADPYYLSRPVEGLFATVNLDTGEVVAVSDSGPVAIPEGPELAPVVNRPPLEPVTFSGDPAANITIDGYGIGWAGWTLRWRADRRFGIGIADGRFDRGSGPQPVLYEAYVADLFVPYQDPDPAWSFRTLLDSAEFGLGSTLSSLVPVVDCPDGARFLDAAIPNDSGLASVRRAAACVFERPTADPAGRHAGSGTDQSHGSGEPATELVLRWISTIGNYDYVIDDIFGSDGSVRFNVFAAGVVLQKAVDPDQTATDVGVDGHGVLIGPGLVGVNHDHYVSFRVDLDVGTPANQMTVERLVPEPVAGDPGRTQIWRLEHTDVATEGQARMTPTPEQPERVLFTAAVADGPAGHRPGYELDFGDGVAVAPQGTEDDVGLRRGGWATDTLWVTPNDPTERFASGLYVPDGSAPAGLPAWVTRDRPIAGADLVLWFTVGFHHVVRTEDLPTMPAHDAGFGLRPTNVSVSNPLLSLA